jgi:hypothetical protein
VAHPAGKARAAAHIWSGKGDVAGVNGGRKTDPLTTPMSTHGGITLQRPHLIMTGASRVVAAATANLQPFTAEAERVLGAAGVRPQSRY